LTYHDSFVYQTAIAQTIQESNGVGNKQEIHDESGPEENQDNPDDMSGDGSDTDPDNPDDMSGDGSDTDPDNPDESSVKKSKDSSDNPNGSSNSTIDESSDIPGEDTKKDNDDTTSDFYDKNDTITDMTMNDMFLVIPEIMGKEGSIWDCQMNAFNSGLGYKQVAEECGTIPDLVSLPNSEDNAILDAAASQAGTGKYQQTTTTTSSPCNEDPRGNPYGEGDDGTQPSGGDDGDDGTQPSGGDDGDDGTQPSGGDDDGDVGKGKGKGKSKTEPKTEPAPKPSPADSDDDLLEPLVPPIILDSVDVHIYDPSKRDGGAGGGSGSNGPSGSEGGPGQDSKHPVGGDDSSKADCIDFFNFLEQCKEINFKTPDCQKLVCDIDTTIALITEEYTCSQSDIDPVKLKKIVFVACQETRKPLPGEDPCSHDKTKLMTAYATQLNPCTDPVAMNNPDEPCPGSPDVMTVLYLTTPQQTYPCPPDGTGIPKTCSGPPPGSNNPPGPIGPGPK
jgi:hypothetical protein